MLGGFAAKGANVEAIGVVLKWMTKTRTSRRNRRKKNKNGESFKHKDKEVKKKCDTALIFLFPAKNKQTEWFTSLV